MTKLNIKQGFSAIASVARKSVRVAKYSFIVAILLSSVVGGYVLVNAELRNSTIDFAQGQVQVEAESPKE